MERARWTDDRLDEKMDGFETAVTDLRSDIAGVRIELRDEIRGLRTEVREEIHGLRTELHDGLGALRADFSAFQDRLITIGFTMVGVLITSMVALIIAVAA